MLENVKKENKMGTMNVNKLLVSMSLPLILTMLIQALYNIVDSIFVARLSEEALSAVSLAFPVQNLMISLAVGTGVGINALLSRSLGEKNQERVDKTANNGIFITLLTSIVVMILGFLFARTFYTMQTDITSIIEQGSTYLLIVTVGSFGLFGEVAFDRLLLSTGKTVYTLFTQGIGAVVNIILDPILIFGLFGFPAMGVTGAAIATVIGQFVGFGLAIYFNLTRNKEITLKRKGFRPDGWIIRRIYAVGIPAILMTSVASIMTFGINKILLQFSSTAVAVFGVYFRLQSFVLMPVFGLNNGMIPIIAYNYGAKNKDRITKTVRYSIFYATGLMLFGLLCFMLFPKELLMMFSASDHMTSLGVPALRTISLCYVFAGFSIVASAVFQALGNGFLSMVTAIVRQLVILLPAAFLLSRYLGVSGVWWSFPIAELASLALSVVFLIKIYRQNIKPLGE